MVQLANTAQLYTAVALTQTEICRSHVLLAELRTGLAINGGWIVMTGLKKPQISGFDRAGVPHSPRKRLDLGVALSRMMLSRLLLFTREERRLLQGSHSFDMVVCRMRHNLYFYRKVL